MPNKPDKFGIKFWMAADEKTKYMMNSFSYKGKDVNVDAVNALEKKKKLFIVKFAANKYCS